VYLVVYIFLVCLLDWEKKSLLFWWR